MEEGRSRFFFEHDFYIGLKLYLWSLIEQGCHTGVTLEIGTYTARQ